MPDMQLVNMKIDPKEREKKYAETTAVAVDAPVYPWGLSLTLDEEVLAKLGIDTLPTVGKPMMLVARVDVTAVSDNEHTSKGSGTHRHRSVSLQITDLQLSPDEGTDKPAAQDALYEKD